MRTISLLVISALVAGCAAPGTQDDAAAPTPAPAPTHLELWSHHKLLEVPVAACGERAFAALQTLGFTGVVRNGDNAYGNSGENRAAVKCVEMPKGSFVYFAVASRDRKTAEELRNRISTKL